MGTRQNLQTILESIPGVNGTYYQPPESVKMKYPAIVYETKSYDTEFADNSPYHVRKRYTITVIDKDPDSSIPEEVLKLPTCVSDRWFAADQLNHWTFNLYY